MTISRFRLCLWTAIAACLLSFVGPAQSAPAHPLVFNRDRTKRGTGLLQTFQPVSAALKASVVRLEVDDKDAALGTVVDAQGLLVTKASELGPGQVVGILSDGRRIAAKILATDEDTNLALVKLDTPGLVPIQWSNQDVVVGQWAITPGVDSLPEAIGVVSVPPRRIYPERAFIGVVLDFEVPAARIRTITPGLGAEKVGLKSGDTILSVNSDEVFSSEMLRTILREFRAGQTVQLRIRRDDQEFEVSVPLMMPKSDGSASRMDRQERMNRMGGDLSHRAEGFESAIQHDTILKPSQCGGPLVNLEGKAIGLNIARAGRVASYALPAPLVQKVVAALLKRVEVPVKASGAEPTSAPVRN